MARRGALLFWRAVNTDGNGAAATVYDRGLFDSTARGFGSARARALARVLPLAPSGSGRTPAVARWRGWGPRRRFLRVVCNFVPPSGGSGPRRREASSAHRVPFVFHSAWIGGGPPTNGAPTAAMADDCGRRSGVYTFPITIITYTIAAAAVVYAVPGLRRARACVCVCVRPVGVRRPSRERYCYYTRIIAIALCIIYIYILYGEARARTSHTRSTRPCYYNIIILLL